LLALLDDILDLSKIESGGMTFEALPTSPASVAEDVRKLLQARAGLRGVGLRCEVEPNVPQHLLLRNIFQGLMVKIQVLVALLHMAAALVLVIQTDPLVRALLARSEHMLITDFEVVVVVVVVAQKASGAAKVNQITEQHRSWPAVY
jgi:hypothetical protein